MNTDDQRTYALLRIHGSVSRARCMAALALILMLGTACTAPGDWPLLQDTSQTDSAPVVATDAGRVAGAVQDGIIAFKGIPYAAPPVGDLRWHAPQPVTPWDAVRPATTFGADCAQAPGDLEQIQTTPAEDCLFVNVWRPVDNGGDTLLPVMVWIHGGGFVGGGTSIPWYDGSAFARQGIIVVSLNYRLSRLGFFAHPALLNAAEGPVGNFGFMDQIAALAWVQRNIDAFGGDPNRVTLVGQSAGGAAVLALLTSPAASGLFDQAVVLSGGGRNGLALRAMTGGASAAPSADQIDAAFAASLGITGDGPAALADLRALPATTVQGDLNLEKLAAEALFGQQRFQGTQMIDDDIVVEHPGALLARGQMPAVPLLIGTTAVDLPLFFPPSKLDPFAFFGSDAAAAQAAYAAPDVLDQESLARILLSMGADMTMHEPARYVARQMTAHGNPVWLYRFTYTATATRPDEPAQSHSGELPFLFDMLGARYGGAVSPADRATAHAFNAYVGNFIKTGDPNGERLTEWPIFDPTQFMLLDFTPDDGPRYQPDPRASRIELVERAFDRQDTQKTGND